MPMTQQKASSSCQGMVTKGTIVEMGLWNGWISPLQAVDHPLASWNRGRIYLSAKDVRTGITLAPGDEVGFTLYVDTKGLGAADCFKVDKASRSGASARRGVRGGRKRRAADRRRMETEAQLACGVSEKAHEFELQWVTRGGEPDWVLRAQAVAMAKAHVNTVQTVQFFGGAFVSNDSDSESGGEGADKALGEDTLPSPFPASTATAAEALAAYSDFSDADDDEGDIPVQPKAAVEEPKDGVPRAPSVVSSTDAGSWTDLDEDISSSEGSMSPPGLVVLPPPGLDVMPPPGLC